MKRLPCQVGGGIRSIESARKMLDAGAQRVILGSTLIQNGAINVAFAKQLAAEFGPEKLVFAIDARGGKIAIRGWKEVTSITPLQMVQALDDILLRISLHPHRHRGSDGRPSAGTGPRIACRPQPGNSLPPEASQPMKKLTVCTRWEWTRWSAWRSIPGAMTHA